MCSFSTLAKNISSQKLRKAVILTGVNHMDFLSGTTLAECLRDAIENKKIDPKRIAFGFETLSNVNPTAPQWKQYHDILKHGRNAYFNMVRDIANMSSKTQNDFDVIHTIFATYPILQLLHDYNISYDEIDDRSFVKAISKKEATTMYDDDGILLKWDNERVLSMIGGVSKLLAEKDIVFTHTGMMHLPALAARCDLRLNTNEVSTKVLPTMLVSKAMPGFADKEYPEIISDMRKLLRDMVVNTNKHNDDPLEQQLAKKALGMIGDMRIAKFDKRDGARSFEDNAFENVISSAVAFIKEEPSPSPAVSTNEEISGAKKGGRD